jgi:hypothetical protein
MTDIYEYKANKYKLKYLKLKRELYGGSDNNVNDVDCQLTKIIDEYDFKKLNIKPIFGEPIYLNIKVIQNKNYHFYYNNYKHYEGRLLSLENYNNYRTNYDIIKKCDPNNYNTPTIIFIGDIDYKYVDNWWEKLKNKGRGKITDYNIIIQYFITCPNFLKRNNITYKYIISEKIIRGDRKNIFINLLKTSSDKKDSNKDYFRSLYINDKNIILILNSLKTAIDNLIKNLYSDGYILDNINEENIILKEIYEIDTKKKDTKVYFYDYSKLKKSNNENKNNDINALCKFIKWLFSRFEFKDTLELVKNLSINSPQDLSTKLEQIINSIQK